MAFVRERWNASHQVKNFGAQTKAMEKYLVTIPNNYFSRYIVPTKIIIS